MFFLRSLIWEWVSCILCTYEPFNNLLPQWGWSFMYVCYSMWYCMQDCAFVSVKWMNFQQPSAASVPPPPPGGIFLPFMCINTCSHRKHMFLFLGSVWLASRVITFQLGGISSRMQIADVTHTVCIYHVCRFSRWLFRGVAKASDSIMKLLTPHMAEMFDEWREIQYLLLPFCARFERFPQTRWQR